LLTIQYYCQYIVRILYFFFLNLNGIVVTLKKSNYHFNTKHLSIIIIFNRLILWLVCQSIIIGVNTRRTIVATENFLNDSGVRPKFPISFALKREAYLRNNQDPFFFLTETLCAWLFRKVSQQWRFVEIHDQLLCKLKHFL